MATLTAKGWKTPELAKAYFHNSEIQRQCAWDLLGSHPFKGNEAVLDFGCRDGKISAEISHFVKKGSVTGVDLSQPMIRLAKLYFPETTFPNLQFKEIHSSLLGDFPKDRLFDRIVSFYTFHLVSDPIAVLKNLYGHLKADGEILLVIPTEGHPNMIRAAEEILIKFRFPLESKKSPARTQEWAREMAIKAGFRLTLLELDERPCHFADSTEMIQWMVGTYSATMGIPFELSQVFFREVFHRWVELDPRVIDKEGRAHFQFNRLKIVGKKH